MDKYETNEEYGGIITFSRKDNGRCLIRGIVSENKLTIDNFHCFPPIGTKYSNPIPRSGGVGKEMMFYFLTHIKANFSKVNSVYLEAHAFPDTSNLTKTQYDEYFSGAKVNAVRLHKYYSSLGFTQSKTQESSFKGNIDHIIKIISLKKGGKTRKRKNKKKRKTHNKKYKRTFVVN